MAEKQEKTNGTILKKETCGIIMPISSSDIYSAEHWKDVRVILDETIISSGFVPNMVSDSNEVGIIHNRIVSNIYNNPIVVCDVSGKNPNVMFELGLRLAFDKATIIIKDTDTNYNFDTSPIEHLTYRRDLRFGDIVDFKKKLEQKIKATYEASKDKNYSTFLKNFVQYKPTLEVKEVSQQEYLIKQIEEIKRSIQELGSSNLYKKEGNVKIPSMNELKEAVYRQQIEDLLNEYSRSKKINVSNLDIDEVISYLQSINKYYPEIKEYSKAFDSTIKKHGILPF